MTRELKTELTREEVTQLLDLYNAVDDVLGDISECFDVSISQLRDLKEHKWKLRSIFEFAPHADDIGDRPCHWKPYVLPDDERAWFYNPDKD